MDKEIAIKVDHVSKTFKIPHEKVSSLRGAAVSVFKGNRGYEEFKALDDVSFEVKKGEFFGIIGRNGSGKSTLLKILAGIYQADKVYPVKSRLLSGNLTGGVKINGRISPFLELGIGFNPELSGRDNVYLNATVLGMSKKEIDKKFDSIVAFSELERFIDQKLKNYSSGMQVRLAFSVSIHANREILLMDEVLAVGDSNFQSKCIQEFMKYKEMGKTVILVSHNIGTIERYCDRAILLRNGKIVKIGDASEVGSEYTNQNMSDEDMKRAYEEQKKSGLINKNNDELKPIKAAEILKVEFLDADGIEKNNFKTDDQVNVKIYFKVHKKPDILNIAFGLYSEKGEQVFSFNTQFDEFDVSKCDGLVCLRFDRMPILKGAYHINTSCFRTYGEVPYDFRPRYKKITFHTNGNANNYLGLIKVDHRWS